MAKLVLLVVASAWAAVLIPPMLRSRIENRPNSSVTDFRRQLSTLQSTSSPTRGGMRTIGRPLAQSPLQRPAAAGRPGQPTHAHHRQASLHSGVTAAPARSARSIEARSQPQFRTHGDPTGQHHRQTHMDRHASESRAQGPDEPRSDVRRRRTNVLFMLVISTACTLFLSATTSSTVMLYVFALSFLALCGYVYLLAQIRQREASGWSDDWIDRY
ncbi:MAG: hypothetical protein E4H05_06060 [Acidimicrobiales bacterium]|nr:MAG: hypothetical protein E4H05_06060 [Acidimicrobiales bacterium]